MGLIFRKRVKVGRRGAVNLSRRGGSVSEKVGPVTLNSRGRASIRLGKGLSFRFKI
ncbi:MAG: hypothetical protein QOG69_1635 [Actinomycetota bacterium]|jgi:hypothetical protein|nr:hypothetical protein [Actinomycetota bacterium]